MTFESVDPRVWFCNFTYPWRLSPQGLDHSIALDLSSIPIFTQRYYQPYIDVIIMKHFCCYSPGNEIYRNTLDQKFIFKECYRLKITFFESETSVPFLNCHIVTTDLNELNCSVCGEQIFFIRFRADQCFLCTEYL